MGRPVSAFGWTKTAMSSLCIRGEPMKITYSLERRPDRRGWERDRDCAQASRGDLLWYFFPGDIGIWENDTGFETKFGWVPILHFALSMIDVCEKISTANGPHARYNFTESDDSISFCKDGGTVLIESTFGRYGIEANFVEFRQAVKGFVVRVVADLGSRYPALREVNLVEEIVSRAEEL
jgi:hypothetical protein